MIDAALRDLVRRRARNRCEYCRLPQSAEAATFHIEHILAQQHTPPAPDDPDNLALACHRCNLHKGTNLSSIDPVSGLIVPLFHPRRDEWQQHFDVEGATIVGRSPSGRASVQLLRFNMHRRLKLRAALIADGEF